MKRPNVISLATGVLIFSIFSPIILSLWLANHRAKESFKQDMDNYSSQVLVRINRIAQQVRIALDTTNKFDGSPCSLEHFRQIQKISYVYHYIKDIFYIQKNNAISCPLLENPYLSVITPGSEYTTSGGYKVWLATRHDLNANKNMVAISNGKYVVMINPDSFLDILPPATSHINVTLIGLRNHNIIAGAREIDPNVWPKLLDVGNTTLEYQNVFYQKRIFPDIGVIILTWSSIQPLETKWYRGILFWVPIGALLSLLSSLLIVYVFRRLQSSRYRILDAIQANDITMHYQPVVSLNTGEIIGAEALARWQQPDGTWISPDIFILMAEQSGVITQLTEYIVRCVFDDLGRWLHQHPEMHISINIAAADLKSETLPEFICQQLLHYQVDPQQVALELTERDLITSRTASLMLETYRKAGHKIYIDDFGVGYSSLRYLQELEVDTLKIDRAFVEALGLKLVTTHIIEMAKSLNLTMVAEGIETTTQRDWLIAHGVQAGQGWLYSKALPKKSFIQWAEDNLKNRQEK